MNVRELKLALESLGDDVEVRIAHQPHWPFEYSIGQVEVVGPGQSEYEVVLGEPWADVETSGEGTKWYLFDPNDEDQEVHGPFDSADDANGALERLEQECETIVYIAEGEQLGYLPSPAAKRLRWR